MWPKAFLAQYKIKGQLSSNYCVSALGIKGRMVVAPS
jgi:hypothetical protein